MNTLTVQDINSITISGYLKENPTIATSQKNLKYSNFTLINKEKTTDKEKLNYIQCIAFGDANCSILTKTIKGDRLLIDGKINQSLYKDKQGVTKDSVKIMANKVYKITDAFVEKEQSQQQQSQQQDFDDDIPF